MFRRIQRGNAPLKERKKMNRRIFPVVLTTFILVVIAISIGNYASNTSAILASQETQEGCKSCHAKLSETLPKDHLPVIREEVKTCLICHVAGGAATAFEWTVHFKHYSNAEFVDDCWSCHLIDQEGNFKPYDGQTAGLKVSKEEVDQMVPYYKSWGTSEYLDHGHALEKLSCVDCHGVFIPKEPVSTEQCFICHGSYKQIVQDSLVHYDAMFPHWTDEEVGCNSCHRAHEESVLLCDQCH